MNAPEHLIKSHKVAAKVESALNTFFTLSLDLLCTTGEDGYFQQLNPAWEKVLGWTESELLHTPWIERVHPDDLEDTLQTEKWCSQEDFVEYENRYRHKDGSYRWLSWRVSCTEDGYCYRVAKDISDAKQAEEALCTRLEFESLITTLSTEFIRLSSEEIDGGINHALRAIGEFAGCDRSYVVLFSDSETGMHASATDGIQANLAYAWHTEAVEPQSNEWQQFPIEPASWWMEKLKRFEVIQISTLAALPPELDNTIVALQLAGIQSIIAVPIVQEKSLIGYTGLVTIAQEKTWSDDIVALLRVASNIFASAFSRKQAESKLRESERRFRAVFNQTFQLSSILALDGTVLDDNQTALDFCQLQQSEIVGCQFWDLQCWTISPETQEQLKQAIAQAAAGNIVRYEADILAPDNTVVTIDFSLKPLKDEHGNVELLIAEGRDLTERKLAEQKLQQAVTELTKWQNRYEAAGQTNNLLLYEWNPQTEEVIWGSNVEEFFGYSREELTGSLKDWIKLFHPDDVENVVQELERAIATREPLHIEYRMRQKDGSYITVEDKGQFYPDSSGSLNRMVGFLTNISDRKQAEEALRATEARFRSLSACSPVGIFLADVEGRCTYNNPRLQAIVGLSFERILGEGWAQAVHPDDREWVFAEWSQCALQGQECSQEYRFQTPTGIVRWVQVRTSPMHSEQGELLGHVGTVEDISDRKQAEAALQQALCTLETTVEERTAELKQANEQLQAEITERKQVEAALRQSEEQFRRIFDEAPIGMALCQLERGFVRVNRAYAAMLGYTESELLSLSFKRITHPEDLELELPYLERAINGEFDGYQLEKRYIKKNQEIVWVHLTCVQIRDEAGEILYCLAMVQDISERKQAEAALRQSEAQFRRIFDQAPLGMGLTSLDGHFFRVNQAWLDMLGYTESELKNLTCEDVTHSEDWAQTIPYLQQIKQGEIDSFKREQRFVNKNQEILWGNLTSMVLRDQAGEILCGLGMVEDITERKQAEVALRQSEEQFRRVFDEAPIGMSLAGMDAQYIRVNRAFFEMLGYTQSELMALTFLDITHPEDLELELPFMEQVIQGAIDSFEIEKRYLTKNREIIWVNLTLIALRNPAGEVLYTLAMIEDVTERKQAEEALRQSEARYRAIIEDQTELICRFKPDGTLTFVNDAYCRYFNKQHSELIGHNFMPVIPKEDLKAITKSLSSLCSEHPIVTYEHRVILPSGEMRWQQWTDRALFDGSDKLLELQAVGRDITKLKQAEAEIIRALERERELSELRSGFVSLVSHEFRTPLTTIQSSAELLDRYGYKLSDERKQNHLKRIQTAVQRMTQLLEDVLTIGKAEAGKLQFEPSSVDLVAFCQDMVETLQINVQQQHKLHFTVSGDCTDALMDEKLLSHILTNLLSNALKYSPQGGTVQFDLICDRSQAVFRIQDSGIGIPSEDLEQLFESFRRASNVGTIPGTGLGLAIVKKCVDLHGGEIAVDSEVGVGTTFSVTLPLKSQADVMESGEER